MKGIVFHLNRLCLFYRRLSYSRQDDLTRPLHRSVTVLIFLATFLITALLRHNWYTTKFTHLNNTVQWILIYSELYTDPHWLIPLSSPQNETPYLISSHSSFYPLFSPWKPLSVPMDLPLLDLSYKQSHTIYAAFCVWLLSLGMFLRFIYVVVCIRNFISSCCWIIFYCMDIHSFMDIWVVSTFWLLWIMLLWTFRYRFLGGHMFSFFFLDMYLGVELIGFIINSYVLIFFLWITKLFSKVAASFYIPISKC